MKQIGGYAPGNYICTCSACNISFKGDKRAVTCKPCAQDKRIKQLELEIASYDYSSDMARDEEKRLLKRIKGLESVMKEFNEFWSVPPLNVKNAWKGIEKWKIEFEQRLQK